jgi:hypothetical protein
MEGVCEQILEWNREHGGEGVEGVEEGEEKGVLGKAAKAALTVQGVAA